MRPERRAIGRWFAAGSVVMVVLAAVIALTFSAVNGMPLAQRKTVQAEFNDVHSLAVNDDVRENSARVGRVAGIELRDGRALVTMELDGNPPVYGNAVARVWDVSALAAKFVELEPGTSAAGPLPDGAVLPASRDEDSADVWRILNIFEPKTRAQMAGFLREFGGGSLAHGPDLNAFLHSGPALLRNVGTVSESMASPQFDLPKLIASSDTLASRFHGRELQISELIRQTDETFKGFTTGNSVPLKTVLAKAPNMLRTLRPALDDINPRLDDTRVAMVNLRDGAKGLGDATPDFRGFLRDSVPVSHQVPDFADDARSPVIKLTSTLDDAQPLVHRAVDTFNYLQDPLHVLAPYGPEAGSLFDRLASFTSRGPEPGKRYATVTVNFGPTTATGSGLKSGGDRFVDPYPKPGQAEHEFLPLGSLPAGIGVGGSK
jgi:phospholipid/cholesterol/gamma-HCH transport system substrate-binding protein